jgi:hypothetical protein
MHELLERLGRRDTRIMEMCGNANQAWTDFFQELSTADVGTLSARLGFFQPKLEQIFDSQTLGQTMMPWTAFANLFDTKKGWATNERRALDLITAFARSNCSTEVKSEARSAAISYELDKHPEFPKGI